MSALGDKGHVMVGYMAEVRLEHRRAEGTDQTDQQDYGSPDFCGFFTIGHTFLCMVYGQKINTFWTAAFRPLPG